MKWFMRLMSEIAVWVSRRGEVGAGPVRPDPLPTPCCDLAEDRQDAVEQTGDGSERARAVEDSGDSTQQIA